MRTNADNNSRARRGTLALSLGFALLATSALARTSPVQSSDDLNATMRVIVDPNAKQPDEILRQIPPPKSKRAGDDSDESTRDLANPNGGGAHVGTPGDNGGTDTPNTPEPPSVPGDVGNPTVPGSPGSGSGSGTGGTPPPRDPPPAPSSGPPSSHPTDHPRGPKPPAPPPPGPSNNPHGHPDHPDPPPPRDRPDRPDHRPHDPHPAPPPSHGPRRG